jgi:hypothetical protein
MNYTEKLAIVCYASIGAIAAVLVAFALERGSRPALASSPPVSVGKPQRPPVPPDDGRPLEPAPPHADTQRRIPDPDDENRARKVIDRLNDERTEWETRWQNFLARWKNGSDMLNMTGVTDDDIDDANRRTQGQGLELQKKFAAWKKAAETAYSEVIDKADFISTATLADAREGRRSLGRQPQRENATRDNPDPHGTDESHHPPLKK